MAVMGSLLVWCICGWVTWLLGLMLGGTVTQIFGGQPKGLGCGTLLLGLILGPFLLIFAVIGALIKR